MPKKDDSPNLESLDEFVRGAQRAAALQTALELELFTRIADGNQSIPALLRVTNWSERGSRILLDAMVFLGLLTKQLNEYALTPTSDTFLVKSKSTYIGDALLARLAWGTREQASRAVKSGKPVKQVFNEASELARAQRASIDLQNWQSESARLQSVWERLGWASDILGQARVLAISCGSALKVLSILYSNGKAHATLLDSPAVLAVAKQLAAEMQILDRVTFSEEDMLTTTWAPNSFDLAWIGGKTQYLSLMQNIGVLRHVYEGLAENGRVVVEAPMSDDARRGPGAIPLHGLDVLLGSAEGDIYTITEYRGMLEAAGFFRAEAVKDEPGLMQAHRLAPTAPTESDSKDPNV